MECTRAKLSSRSVINDSAGFAGRTMGIVDSAATSRSRSTRTGPTSGRGSTPTVRLSSFDRHQIDGSSLMGPDKPVTTLERWKDEDLATLPRDGPLQEQERAERRGPRPDGVLWCASCGELCIE